MSAKKISRREMLKGLGLAAASAALAACAPKVVEKTVIVEKPVEKVVKETVIVEGTPKVVEKVVTVAPTPVKPVTIDWWWKWGGLGAKGLKACARMFEQSHPSIRVNALPSVAPEKAITAIAGGTPPDVLHTAIWAQNQMMAQGQFLPITEWVETSDVIDMDDFLETSWMQCSWEGKIYAVPACEHGFPTGFAYNVDLVKEAGLDPDNPPLTWDEAFEWHMATTKIDEAGNIRVFGFDPKDAVGPEQHILEDSWGVKFYDKETMQYNFDDPRVAEWLAYFKRIYDSVGGPEKAAAFGQAYGTWTGSPQARFPSGVEAMIVNGYWMPGELAHTAPDLNVAYTWLPQSKERRGTKVMFCRGAMLSIPKQAKHPEAAFELMEFMTTDAAIQTIFELVGWLVARKSWLAKLDLDAVYKGLDFYIKSIEEADIIVGDARDPLARFTGKQWRDAIEAVIYGDKTPQEAAKNAQEACTEELRKWKET